MRTERVSWVNNLGTIQDLFVRVGHEATYESSGNHNSFTILRHRQTYRRSQNYDFQNTLLSRNVPILLIFVGLTIFMI